MTEYRVSWTVDITAHDPVEAAVAAFNMMQQPRDPNDPDAAVVFEVWQSFDSDPMGAVEVDLAALEYPIGGNARIGYVLTGPEFWTLYDSETDGLLGPATGEQVRASLAAEPAGHILIDNVGNVLRGVGAVLREGYEGGTPRKVYVA